MSRSHASSREMTTQWKRRLNALQQTQQFDSEVQYTTVYRPSAPLRLSVCLCVCLRLHVVTLKYATAYTVYSTQHMHASAAALSR